VSEAAPRVSVVIATYNWSTALRLAVRSALAQSLADLEVLVIGDGCTDDSEKVVESFGDPRLRWHPLERNSGSQAAPNNAGLARVRAPLVAYLGHDDLWHPDHLASLVATLEERCADLAHALTLSYGPPANPVRSLSGFELPPGDPRQPDLRTSSVLHRKELVARVGPWPRPEECARPIDDEFFGRLFRSGVRFAGSGRLSTFKFPSSLRRNVYRLRAVAEQEELWRRMASEPDFVERELSAFLAAQVAGRGWISLEPIWRSDEKTRRDLRRFRGLDGTPSEEPAVERGLPAGDRPGLGWHGVETDRRGPFRWTGPSVQAGLEVPVPVDSSPGLVLRVKVIRAVDPAQLDGLRFAIEDQTLAPPRRSRRPGGHLFEAPIPDAALRGGSSVGVTLTVPFTVSPHERDPSSSDRRQLGVAVRWVEIVATGSPARRPSRRLRRLLGRLSGRDAGESRGPE